MQFSSFSAAEAWFQENDPARLGDSVFEVLAAPGVRRLLRDQLIAIFDAASIDTLGDLLRRGDRTFGGKEGRPLRAALLELVSERISPGATEERAAPQGVQSTWPTATLEALRAWLAERNALPLLDVPINELVRSYNLRVLKELWAFFAHRSSETIAESYLRERFDTPLATEEVLHAQLFEAIRFMIKARDEASDFEGSPVQPAGSRPIGVLLESLRRKRQELLRTIWPHLMADHLPAQIRIQANGERQSVELYAPPAVNVAITFPRGLGDPELRCERDHHRPCSHQIFAIERCLDSLLAKIPDPRWLDLVNATEKRPWEHMLESLAKESESRHAALALEEELIWLVTGEPPFTLKISPATRRRGKRSGEWTQPKPRPPEALSKEQAHLLSDTDARAIELLSLSRDQPLRLSLLVLDVLIGTPRVFYSADKALTPLQIEAYPVRLVINKRDEQPEAVAVGGGVVFEDVYAPLVIDPAGGRVVLGRVSAELRALKERIDRVLPSIRAEELPRLAEACLALSKTHPIEVGDIVEFEERPPREDWVLRLKGLPEGALEASLFVHPVAEGPLYLAGEEPTRAMGALPDGRLVAADRRLEVEAARLSTLWEQWTGSDRSGATQQFTIAEHALSFLSAVRDDPRGVRVEWEEKPWRLPRQAAAQDLKLEIADGGDWFAMRGELKVDEHTLTLAAILEAVRRRSRFLRVTEDTWVEIEQGLRERLERLEPHLRSTRGRLELSAFSGPTLEAELSGSDLKVAERWQATIARARQAEQVEPILPPRLQASLRPYQLEGFGWLSRLAAWGAGAVLADDMGLGKTVQTIAALLDRAPRGPALVVAPTSVSYNWVREIQRFAPDLRVTLFRGADRAGPLERFGPSDVVVISYALLTLEAERLQARRWATLVLDEAQAVKNASAQRSIAVRGLDAEWAVALTGTPIENHIGELWAIFAAVAPGLLGSQEQFRERWGNAQDLRGLARVVRPFVLRRTKGEVLQELPPKTEMQIDVELNGEERKIYEEARLAAIAELKQLGPDLGQATRFHVLAALTRLRQLASDGGTVGAPTKLLRLADLAEPLIEEGHHVLVFSQFVKLLDRAEAVLRARSIPSARLDGSTPAEDRAPIVDRFQAGPPSVLLVSLKAGGTGLNLTAADHVVLLDPWWNPAVEDQAADRAHRIGQTRPVTVIRLVSRETVEEAMLALHQAKRELGAKLFSEGTGAEALSPGELFELLGR